MHIKSEKIANIIDYIDELENLCKKIDKDLFLISNEYQLMILKNTINFLKDLIKDVNNSE